MWKNWLVPVDNTKWKNQWTFTRKQVKKTSKRWQIWVFPRNLRAKMKSKLRHFCRSRNKKNTQYKTKSDLNAWKKFCESLKGSRAIENIPANELDLLLSKFFISVRKTNGTEYEPTTKTRLLQPNSMTQTRRRFLITPLERPVLDDFSKQTFSQTSLHS